jgi:O-antigen/teichoic acid export membrane protein
VRFGGVTRILAGSTAGQGLILLSYPFLSRIYEPADFGLLVVFTAVVGMVAVVSTASLDAAIPLAVDDRTAAAVAWASLTSVVLTASLTAAVGVFAAEPTAALLGTPKLADLWWLVPITVLVMGMYAVFSECLIRDRQYGALGQRNLVQGIGQVATQVGLGSMGLRPVGLLLGLTLGRLASTAGMAARGGLLRRSHPDLTAIRSAVGRYRRFPLITTWSKFLNVAGLDAPLLIISAAYGDAQAGLLGLTIRVVGGPVAVIGQAVHQVFTGEASARIREPGESLGSWIRSRVLRLLAVGLVPAALLAAFGPALFGMIFGAEWTRSGEFAQILAVSYLASFAIAPISHTLLLLERQGQQLAWDSARLVLTVGGVSVCAVLGSSITTAIVVLSVAHVCSYLVMYLLSVHAADRSDRARVDG